ncbi:MAG TPA: kelch repeat-containing protein [Tepidisphaeraceae bacterium]|jgi:N-acetylneuraminic acid mutarotase
MKNLPRLSLIESLEARQLLHGAFPVTIDFGPSNAPVAGGTIGDHGAVFADRGNGFQYGWNIDTSANAVDRNSSYTPYQRLDTNIAMQQNGARTWDLHVHSGKYKVKISGGDSAIWGSKLNITAEGQTVVTGTTTDTRRFIEATVTLDVVDGNLSIGNGTGAIDNRITYITIEHVGPATTPTPPPVEPTPTNPVSNVSWTTVASAPIAKAEGFGGTMGSKLYVFGGYVDFTYKPSTSAHVYDRITNTWKSIRSLPVGLTHVATAQDDTGIYFVGGYPGTGANGTQVSATTSVWKYTPATDSYTQIRSLPEARGGGAATLLGRTLYFMGGNDLSRRDRVETWALNLDNQAAGWVQRASLPAARNHPAAVTINGSVYFLAGQTGQDGGLVTKNDLYRYNPATNAWTSAASLPGARSHVTSTTFVYQNKIMVLGGESSHNSTIRNVDLFDPATNKWTNIGQLPAGRFSGVSGLLDDGRIIYSTGYSNNFQRTTWIGKLA